MRAQYLAHWQLGLHGPCAYYAASPLVPPRGDAPGASLVSLPESMLRIEVPTHILWGEKDVALRPELLDGLHDWIGDLHIQRIPNGSHWLVHEMPQLVIDTVRQITREDT